MTNFIYCDVENRARLSKKWANLLEVLQKIEGSKSHVVIKNGPTQIIEFDFENLENLDNDYMKFLFKTCEEVKITNYYDSPLEEKRHKIDTQLVEIVFVVK